MTKQDKTDAEINAEVKHFFDTHTRLEVIAHLKELKKKVAEEQMATLFNKESLKKIAKHS